MKRTSSHPTLDGLSQDDAVSAIVAWFYENFVDPDEVPSGKSTSSTQYVFKDKTFDPREVIERRFGGSGPHEVLEESINAIMRRGDFGWFQRNLQAPEVEDHEDSTQNFPSAIWDSSVFGDSVWGDDADLEKTIRNGWESPQVRARSFPPDLSNVSADDAPEEIKDWFLENFEDPANMTPFESAEGGYQYIWGGPFDAEEEVREAFEEELTRLLGDDVATDVIAKSVELIQEGGNFDWAPSSSRITSEEEYEDELLKLREKYQLLQNRIEELERCMAALPPPPHFTIGHNNPPEPISRYSISIEDREKLESFLRSAKSVPPPPAPLSRKTPSEISAGLDVAKSIVRATLGYSIKQADNFISEAVKTAGKTAGVLAIPAVIGLGIWGDLFNRIVSLVDSARSYFSMFGL